MYHLVGRRTLVWTMNTFEPENCQEFIDTVSAGFLFAFSENLNKLIIDLTGNGGGLLCLGRSALSWLFPDHSNYGPTNMPSSNSCARNLTQTAIKYNISYTQWSPDFYQSDSTDTQYANNDISWIDPGQPHQYGGTTRNYTELIHVSSESEQCGTLPLSEETAPFSPDKILMVSQGECGSTCAEFANALSNYHNVSSVVLGGYTSVTAQMQYTSFPGLEVLETPSFYDILNRLHQDTTDLNCQSCSAPRNFLTSANFRFCNRQIFGPTMRDNPTSNQAPLEYTWQPATHRFMFETIEQAENQENVYFELLRYLE
mmetsp:Transcript_9200/g.13911  ORF Transcript_9200/g.13911 Transcript_9200/m.13911 type:complete len:314 (+) Transcript_9200:993-1934(+)